MTVAENLCLTVGVFMGLREIMVAFDWRPDLERCVRKTIGRVGRPFVPGYTGPMDSKPMQPHQMIDPRPSGLPARPPPPPLSRDPNIEVWLGGRWR